ncbi:hypothetical protein WR25_21187 [Diploscapter pachys]|uniref:UBZ4-type domain-containing protein n=1 Tax=Diploscapter pachys TaxID=2018661 RepID=A0A2A2LD21_9BILA|nr:hypothetical protein WR25_21187 [Diploscapter pachys]
MPSFVSCKFCDRLYSAHSLQLHEKKCLDNPQRPEPNLQNKSDEQAPTKPSKKSTKLRPKTMSLSRGNSSAHSRVCYVCGQELPEETIEKHEKRCFEEWKAICASFSKKFEFRIPQPLSVPSVDGTKDNDRLNKHAKEQSHIAQRVRKRHPSAQISNKTNDAIPESSQYCHDMWNARMEWESDAAAERHTMRIAFWLNKNSEYEKSTPRLGMNGIRLEIRYRL